MVFLFLLVILVSLFVPKAFLTHFTQDLLVLDVFGVSTASSFGPKKSICVWNVENNKLRSPEFFG